MKEKEAEKNKDENIEDKNRKIELYQELTKKKLEIEDKMGEEFKKIIEQLETLSKISSVQSKKN